MALCKLTQNVESKECGYAVAGATDLYLANYYPASVATEVVPNTIQYKFDGDGILEGITLPTGEKFYKVQASENTLSYTDALLAGGNGGKYRQHTVNAVIGQSDIDVLNQADALSLGKFIAVIVDKKGDIRILGRTSGLTAPAGGFDYNSGAQDADATGWTLIQQGVSMETAPMIKDLSVLKIADSPVVGD